MKTSKIFGIQFLLAISVSLQLSATYRPYDKNEIILTPASGLMTETICSAINQCAAKGGGTVRFTAGTFLTGTLELKSNVTLLIEKGAILLGSSNYADYRNDAFIFGKDLKNISIQGEGVIDGVDCYNPHGEEGFRGPHCIRLINCDQISFSGFTIQRSANWAINCRYCKNGKVENVKIRGGHDGLHTRFCENFTVNGCDFRTGDDAFAGNDNQNFTVSNCKINTSCNGFRLGCLNLSVKQCQFWGPGESVHKIQKRNNMLAAFVHFSPKDENPELLSGNWIIEDCTIDNVDYFYNYNYESGLWQTGKPVTSLHFNNIKATNLLNAFAIMGDKQRQLELSILNSSFSFREGSPGQNGKFEGASFASDAFFNATNFGTIVLKNVTLQKSGETPVLILNSGKNLQIEGLSPNKLLSTSQFTNIIQFKKQ